MSYSYTPMEPVTDEVRALPMFSFPDHPKKILFLLSLGMMFVGMVVTAPFFLVVFSGMTGRVRIMLIIGLAITVAPALLAAFLLPGQLAHRKARKAAEQLYQTTQLDPFLFNQYNLRLGDEVKELIKGRTVTTRINKENVNVRLLTADSATLVLGVRHVQNESSSDAGSDGAMFLPVSASGTTYSSDSAGDGSDGGGGDGGGDGGGGGD